MFTRLCTTLELVLLIRHRRNLRGTTTSTSTDLPIRLLVVIVGGKANRGTTLANPSTRIWIEPRWTPLSEALPRITSNSRTDTNTIIDQSKTHDMSQQGCSDPPSPQLCINSMVKRRLVTQASVGARTRPRLVWSNTDLTAQKRTLSADTVTNTLISEFHEPRRRPHCRPDATSLLQLSQNDLRGRSRRTPNTGTMSISQNRRCGRETLKRKMRT